MPRLVEGICPLFTQSVLQNCKASGIQTVADFLSEDPEDLAKKIKTPYKDVLSIHHALILKYAGFPQNALSLRLELLDSISILNTGSRRLNKFLHGGIYTGELTEIHGVAGSGKTQLCLSVISNLILETLNTVFYIDTNGNFTAKRVEQIVLQKSNEDKAKVNRLENVKIRYVHDVYSLFDCLDALKDGLYKQESLFMRYLKLVVIDSITPLLAPCFGGKCLDGMGLMDNLVQQLQLLCSDHKLAILVCNNTVQGKNGLVKPALGLNWKYAPSVSLCIEKSSATSLRRMKAVKSCRSSLSEESTFNISEAGITD